MKLKIKATAIILLIFTMTTLIASCGAEKANQNAVPHDITAKILSELNITPESYTSEEDESGEVPTIAEYYSASEEYTLDYMGMMIVFTSGYDNLTSDDFVDYSIINYNKTAMVPFELVIIKLPKKDGKVDENLVKSVESLCQAKLNALVEWIEPYAPQQLNTAKKASVKTYDNYVYYCLAEKASTAEEIINNAITAAE